MPTALSPEIREKELLAPLEIWEVMLDNSTIKFYQPLVLTPEFLPDDPEEPDDNEYLYVSCPALNIDVFAVDREELQDALDSTINFAWRHYVQPDDSELNAEIRIIKQNYLAIAEEIFDA